MFYAFDVLVRRGEDLTKQTLSKRREILGQPSSFMIIWAFHRYRTST